MKIRALTKHDDEKEPFGIWNALVDSLVMEQFGEISPEQRPSYLVFCYKGEVQNGGHVCKPTRQNRLETCLQDHQLTFAQIA
jgi:hypothetical protein